MKTSQKSTLGIEMKPCLGVLVANALSWRRRKSASVAEIKIIDESVRNSDFSCITDLDQFKTLCLDSTVLRTALVGMVEMGFQPVPPEPIPHRYTMQFLQVY